MAVNSGKPKIVLIIGPLSREDPIKSLLSVCPTVQHFSQEWFISLFFNIGAKLDIKIFKN